MATVDLASNIYYYPTLTPQVWNENQTGTSVNCAGFESVTLLVMTGAYTDGTQTLVLQDSPDNTTWTNVASNLLIPGNLPGAISTNASENKVFWVGYAGPNPYVRVNLTVTAAGTGAVYGAAILLGTPHTAPTVLTSPNQVG